ncbi:hypothetical protein U1Q18_052742 [Sarracenia purpurea var. burkii]
MFTAHSVSFQSSLSALLMNITSGSHSQFKGGDGVSTLKEVHDTTVKVTNNSTATKPSGSKKRAMVWDHFTKMKIEDRKPKSTCNYCDAHYASDLKLNGIRSMLTHLESQCKKYPYKTVDKGQQTLGFNLNKN